MEKFQVNELVMNFRSALVSLVPSFDGALIHWKEESQQYDDFDDISECLFKCLVIRTIAYGLNDFSLLDTQTYGMLPQAVSEGPFIAVVSREENERIGRFLNFSTKDEPFDQVVTLPIEGKIADPFAERVSLYFEDVRFVFLYADGIGEPREISEVDVGL